MVDKKEKTNPGVLFVDDEKNILHSLNRLFMDEEFTVHTASSGTEGLEIISKINNIGVVVSDQRMPGLTGVEFLEKTREVRPDAMRILLTGYSDIAAVSDAINRGGAYRYITKPWNDEELVRIVREALNIYSLTRENKRLNEIVRKQNKRLKNWNSELEQMVQEQTIELSRQNDELRKLTSRQRANFKSMISALSSLIELRDKKVKSHSRNVAELSMLTARSMGLSRDEIETVIVAAMLHDIGKIGVSDAILIKNTDEMTQDEIKEYLLHPIRGQAVMEFVDDLRSVGLLVRHHHERFDGTGYPDRLKGEEIPLGARIITAADFLDWCMNENGGNRAIDSALKRMGEESGKGLDPQVCKYLREPALEYYSRMTPKQGMVEMELTVDRLKEGMTISRDVKSGTGLLLLSCGMMLNEQNILTLKRYYRVDPSKSGIFVWVQR